MWSSVLFAIGVASPSGADAPYCASIGGMTIPAGLPPANAVDVDSNTAATTTQKRIGADKCSDCAAGKRVIARAWIADEATQRRHAVVASQHAVITWWLLGKPAKWPNVFMVTTFVGQQDDRMRGVVILLLGALTACGGEVTRVRVVIDGDAGLGIESYQLKVEDRMALAEHDRDGRAVGPARGNPGRVRVCRCDAHAARHRRDHARVDGDDVWHVVSARNRRVRGEWNDHVRADRRWLRGVERGHAVPDRRSVLLERRVCGHVQRRVHDRSNSVRWRIRGADVWAVRCRQLSRLVSGDRVRVEPDVRRRRVLDDASMLERQRVRRW
jgi:hypothetical protein